MGKRKEDYIVLALALLLVGVVVGIGVVVFFQSRPTIQTVRPPIGVAPTAIPAKKPAPTPKPITITMSGVKILFNTADANKLADLTKNRRELSVADIRAKDKILFDLFAIAPSGYVYQSNNVGIEYRNSQDQFAVEIRTPDIANAKKEAADWFLSQGFTEDGICKMPIRFYLNNVAAKSLEGTTLLFSPLMSGCE